MTRPERFEGRIGRTLAESEPWFDEPPHPGEGAPNVVVVLIDDTGFAQLGCYGGDVATPNIDALAAASGPEFDRLFLSQMIPHHRSAVAMAETEIADGSNPDAVDMAREIVESQTAEIEEMQTLLTELGG